MFRWGILGTARINSKIIPLLESNVDQKFVAIASRNVERAKAYANQHKIEQSYGNYEELVTSANVEAIYNSLPNDQHFHWTKIALENGKHVLCEKPLVLNSKQLVELIEVSKRTKCILMEGFMYRHHKQIKILRELISSEKLGHIHHVRSSFHFTMPSGPNIRMNVANGGGAIWDLGCYIIDLSNFIFSRKPKSVAASASYTQGIDTIFSGFLNYGDGETASFDCSFQGARRDFLEIVGSHGTLMLERPFKGGPKETIKILSTEGIEELVVEDLVNPYLKEFENFYRSTLKQTTPVVSLQESLSTVKTIEALITAAKTGLVETLE